MRKFVFIATICLILSATSQGAGELSGRRAPGFALPNVADPKLAYHDLADYRGRIVLIEIMQTNCPHCREFLHVLEEVKAKYGDRVAILSVVNPPDTQRNVAAYVSATKATMPILYDCGQMAASYLKVTPQNPAIDVPHVFIIDGEGTIRDDYGYTPDNHAIFEGKGLFAVIDRLLAGGRKK
jgi:thiol-disulfide isomerase/thioredoxin